jgi:hypothetical protein
MSQEELLLERWRTLSPKQQQQLLSIAEQFAIADHAGQPPTEISPINRRSFQGLWANLGIDITEQDLRDVRQEMWPNFPREDLL